MWVPRATIKTIKIITTVKMYRTSAISLGRQEVTGLFGGFLVKTGPGALQRESSEITGQGTAGLFA